MRASAKTFIVGLIASVTFAFGAAPASATAPAELFSVPAESVPAAESAQSLSVQTAADTAVDAVLTVPSAGSTPHNFDVAASIALAESEVGTSRATGWSQPGECIMSAQRWVRAGGGNWAGGGNPVTNYDGATRLTIADAQPGDIVQYENIEYPTSWVTGVHTLMITAVNGDGTFTIIESNNPSGTGLVTKDEHWTPNPPSGFQAVVWRF